MTSDERLIDYVEIKIDYLGISIASYNTSREVENLATMRVGQ